MRLLGLIRWEAVPLMYDIIITTDRSMMSNHHGKEFIGFMNTGPSIYLPESLWMWISAPKVKVDNKGRPIEAPYGLRKVEAKLLEAGFNVAIIDPDYLSKYADKVKVMMIGHHDYFALGPPSYEWWALFGREPVNRRSFIKFMSSSVVRRIKDNGAKFIVGGPAAWQWLYELSLWKDWGVDTVIDGEAEKIIVDIADKALNNGSLPDYIYVGPKDTPTIDEIPLIRGASINGLVEIMRGCPRRCSFCSVTLRPLRMIPLDKILREVMVNIKYNIRNVILHSEDVLLYHGDGVKPREKPITKLHEEILKLTDGTIAWSHVSLASVKYAEEKYSLISKLMNEMILPRGNQEILGVEIGIETGSMRLARKAMPRKSAPYPVEMWREIVIDAFRIMHENSIVPAATLIVGLPGETINDVLDTIELIEKLRPYRSLIVPMLFVPLGAYKDKAFFRREYLKKEHLDLMYLCLEHSLYWAKKLVNKYINEKKNFFLRFLLNAFIRYIDLKFRGFKEGLDYLTL